MPFNALILCIKLQCTTFAFITVIPDADHLCLEGLYTHDPKLSSANILALSTKDIKAYGRRLYSSLLGSETTLLKLPIFSEIMENSTKFMKTQV